MGSVDEYLAGLPAGANRAELERIRDLIATRFGALDQGVSYAMPCYLYRGVPVAAVMVTKKHLAWYPYSGSVLAALGDGLASYDRSPGTLRFSAASPLAEKTVWRLVEVRMRQIDEKLATRPATAP